MVGHPHDVTGAILPRHCAQRPWAQSGCCTAGLDDDDGDGGGGPAAADGDAPPPPAGPAPDAPAEMEELSLEPQPGSTPMYHNVVFHEHAAAGQLALPHRYSLTLHCLAQCCHNLDLAGPKLAFNAGLFVDLLIKSGTHNYLEFKQVEASYLWAEGRLSPVPASRADVFKDRSLSPADKRHLMWFFKLAASSSGNTAGHNVEGVGVPEQSSSQLSKAGTGLPFAELLKKEQLPLPVQNFILYAIALASEDQDAQGPGTFSADEGLRRMALYFSSLGRFGQPQSAFLYPLYGQGELPQAFCRIAAVKGATYVLRRPIASLLLDKVTRECRGVRTRAGQLLFCSRVLLGPEYLPALMAAPASTSDDSQNFSSREQADLRGSSQEDSRGSVARSVCITNKSLQEGLALFWSLSPPKVGPLCATGSSNVSACLGLSFTTLGPLQQTCIHVLQLSSTSSICPSGQYIVQLSCSCSPEQEAEQILGGAVEELFDKAGCRPSGDPSSQTRVSAQDEEAEVSGGGLTSYAPPEKPELLWCCYYNQDVPSSSTLKTVPGNVEVCGMPDASLTFESIMDEVKQHFHKLYREDSFYAEIPMAEGNTAEDADEEGSGDRDLAQLLSHTSSTPSASQIADSKAVAAGTENRGSSEADVLVVRPGPDWALLRQTEPHRLGCCAC
eukprot:SM000088S23766  [mRNA]  locus=s88:514964:518693:- [translate_table: standard]